MDDVERNALRPGTAEAAYTSGQDEHPPSYDSVYGRLKSMSEESNGPADCFKKFTIILCGSVIGTILLGITLAIPIAMIAIGSIYIYDCPAERYIPIYLVVAGVFGTVQVLLTTTLRIKNQKEKKEDENARPNPFSGFISCFCLIWFIAGSVWVYRTFWHFTTDDPHKVDYCHPTLYWFSFCLITSTYIILALGCCCLAAVGLVACCLSKSD